MIALTQSMLLSFTASNWVDMRQTAMGSRSP